MVAGWDGVWWVGMCVGGERVFILGLGGEGEKEYSLKVFILKFILPWIFFYVHRVPRGRERRYLRRRIIRRCFFFFFGLRRGCCRYRWDRLGRRRLKLRGGSWQGCCRYRWDTGTDLDKDAADTEITRTTANWNVTPSWKEKNERCAWSEPMKILNKYWRDWRFRFEEKCSFASNPLEK